MRTSLPQSRILQNQRRSSNFVDCLQTPMYYALRSRQPCLFSTSLESRGLLSISALAHVQLASYIC
jgi:hypothetical protein